MVQSGAISPLLSLLSSTHLEVQEQSVWALGNIAGDCDEYREKILQSNGFSLIIAFAQSNLDKIGVVKNCMWCLSNLCRNQQKLPGLFQYIQPHLRFLQQMLYCNVTEVVSDACWAFSFLLDAEAAQKKVVIPFVNPTYLMRLIFVDNIRLQSPALRVAGNIVTGDSEDTQLMLDAGLLQVLVSILPKAKELQKKDILWIVSNVTAGNPTQIRAVIDRGFIEYLISVMNTESPILQIEAAWAVCNAINGGTVEQVEREGEE